MKNFKKAKYRFSLLIILFISLLLLRENLWANILEYEYNLYIDSKVFSVLDLYREDLFNPIIISDEEIFYTCEHKYNFHLKDYGISIGYIKKYQRDVKFDKDTVNFLYNLGTESKLKSNYTGELDEYSQLLDGIYLGFNLIKFKDYNLKIDFVGKLLRGKELKRSYYNGVISFRDDKPVIDGYRNSVNSRVGQQTSQEGIDFYSIGFSLDLLFKWQIDELESLSLSLKDIYSFIYWHDVYTNVGSYTSDNIIIEEGFIKYLSSYSGRYFYKNYYSKLSSEINLVYQKDRLRSGLIIRNKTIPFISYQVYKKDIKGELLTITAGLYLEQKQIELDYSSLNLKLFIDEFDLSKSNTFSASCGLNINF